MMGFYRFPRRPAAHKRKGRKGWQPKYKKPNNYRLWFFLKSNAISPTDADLNHKNPFFSEKFGIKVIFSSRISAIRLVSKL